MQYLDEITFWLFLATAIALFTLTFKPLALQAAARLPLPAGLKEILAA